MAYSIPQDATVVWRAERTAAGGEALLARPSDLSIFTLERPVHNTLGSHPFTVSSRTCEGTPNSLAR